MALLITLFSLSHSYFCKETLEVHQNVPESYEGPLGDGEVLCINSTVAYLTLVPQQTTLLLIRYFSRKFGSSQVVSSGHFFFPSEIAAVGFGNNIGHIEIQALIPGIVSLSTFAFPPECRQRRYVTTMEDDGFSIEQRLSLGSFGETIASVACIWSPHPLTSVSTNSNLESRDAIRVCLPGQCTAPLNEDGRVSFDFRSDQYLQIDANKPDFVEHFKLILSVKQSANFLDAHGLLENDGEVGTIKLHPRDANEKHPELNDDETLPKIPEPVASAQPGKAAPVLVPPLFRPRRRSGRPIRSVIAVLQVLALAAVVVSAIVCLVNYFLFAVHQRRDDAQSTLLGQVDPRGPFARVAQFFPGSPNYGAGFYQSPGGLGYVYPTLPFPGAVVPAVAPVNEPPQQPQ
jgi:hypothetical protein